MNERANILVGEDGRARCGWVGADADYARYHDEEWGRPLHGDRQLFEKLSLEGFQAGLSWITILRRREGFREAFHDFDPARVARFGANEIEALMTDARIIRNRAKIEATIGNALVTLRLTDGRPGALDELLWRFSPAPRPVRVRTLAELPAFTAESTALSAELRKIGYRFVGPTTIYALMQSSGIIDDHLEGCWRAAEAPSPAVGAEAPVRAAG